MYDKMCRQLDWSECTNRTLVVVLFPQCGEYYVTVQPGTIIPHLWYRISHCSFTILNISTVCLQMNGALSKVNKKFISHLTQAKRTPSAAATVPSFSCATSSSLFMLTAGPWDQFPRWRRSRKRLSVCSVLRCPDPWLQCSVSFVHGLEKTHAWKTWTVAAADGVRCACVRWEINLLLTFENLRHSFVYNLCYNIKILWDHRPICSPSLTQMSLCGAGI